MLMDTFGYKNACLVLCMYDYTFTPIIVIEHITNQAKSLYNLNTIENPIENLTRLHWLVGLETNIVSIMEYERTLSFSYSTLII